MAIFPDLLILLVKPQTLYEMLYGHPPFTGEDIIYQHVSRPVTFPNNGCAHSLYADAHFGDIDREERPTIFAGQYTAGFNGFPAPTIEAKDPIGLCDRVPALDIRKLPSMGLARANLPVIEIAPQRYELSG